MALLTRAQVRLKASGGQVQSSQVLLHLWEVEEVSWYEVRRK